LEMDARPEVNSKQRRVGDEYAIGGIHLQTSLPPPDRGRCLPELPAASRASCLLPPEPSTSSRASDLQTLRPPNTLRPPPDPSTASRPAYLHTFQTSRPPGLHTCMPSRPLDLCGSMPTRPPYVHDPIRTRPPYIHDFRMYTTSRPPYLHARCRAGGE
jgi:hypothetical protein